MKYVSTRFETHLPFSDPAIFPFICPRGCGATFKKITSMTKNHLASGQCPIPLSCPRCPETFEKQFIFNQHVKTCTVEAAAVGLGGGDGGPVGAVQHNGEEGEHLEEVPAEPLAALGGEALGEAPPAAALGEVEVPLEELERMLEGGELEMLLGQFGEFPGQAAGIENEL